MRAGYVIDDKRWEALNRDGKTYWWAYIEEVLDRLGLTAEPIHASDLKERLPEFSLLFLGDMDAGDLADDLSAWNRNGGSLIACLTEGLDGIFGIETVRRIPQPNGDFSIAGELHLSDYHERADEIRFPLHAEKPLLIASDIRLVRRASNESVPFGFVEGEGVMTVCKPGIGWAHYFGFDLAKTFWVIQQGRPVDADHDGDGYLRTGDALVTGDYEPEIPYTDELLILLQRLVGHADISLIHQLPPLGDQVPDVLLFYGGDDEGSTGLQVPAAEFMASRKLPYHINCMLLDGKYGLNQEEIRRLDELGVELTPHFNFINGFKHPVGFTRDDMHGQARAFMEHFGRQPLTSNCHWCRWTGYHEPAVWLNEVGIRGDNSFAHRRLDVLNPVNTMGFAFGTAFPFHLYTDGTMGNRQTGVTELPITAYEVGYTKESADFPTLERALDLAVHYGQTMNFFYHPVYITENPFCRNAIDRLLGLIEEWGITAVHSTPDALVRWWKDRSNTVISDAHWEDDGFTFTVRTPSPSGCIVKTRYVGPCPPETSLPHRVVEVGKYAGWLMIVVPPGETRVELRWE